MTSTDLLTRRRKLSGGPPLVKELQATNDCWEVENQPLPGWSALKHILTNNKHQSAGCVYRFVHMCVYAYKCKCVRNSNNQWKRGHQLRSGVGTWEGWRRVPGGGCREERGQIIEFYFESKHSSTSDQEQHRCFTQWRTLRHGHCDVCYNIHYLSFLLSLTSLYYLFKPFIHAKQGSWSYLSFQCLLLFSTSPKIFPCYLSNHKIQNLLHFNHTKPSTICKIYIQGTRTSHGSLCSCGLSKRKTESRAEACCPPLHLPSWSCTAQHLPMAITTYKLLAVKNGLYSLLEDMK